MNIFHFIREIYLLLLAALFVTIVTCAIKFDAVMQGSGSYLIVLSIAVLILYGITSFRLPNLAGKQGIDQAIKNGSLFGVITGVIWIAHLTIEHFMSGRGNDNPALSIGMMIVIFALYWVAAFRTILKTGKIPASLFAALWSAMTGALMFFVYGFVLFFTSYQMIERNLEHAYVESGMSDLTSFIILNIIQSGTTHLIAAPVVSVIFGATAVLIVQISSRIRK